MFNLHVGLCDGHCPCWTHVGAGTDGGEGTCPNTADKAQSQDLEPGLWDSTAVSDLPQWGQLQVPLGLRVEGNPAVFGAFSGHWGHNPAVGNQTDPPTTLSCLLPFLNKINTARCQKAAQDCEVWF